LAEPITAVLLQAAELTAAGRPRKAVELLRPVVAANPHHPEAWARLAAALLDAGNAGEALDAATRALALGVDAAWAHRVAALALSELDRHDEAAVAARAAVRANPGEWRCQVALAEALAARAATDDDATEAADAARRASKLAPGQPRPYEVLGDLALRVRDWGAAEWAYRAALKLDPQAEHAKRNLALVGRQRARRRGAPTTPSTPTTAPPVGAEAVLWRLVVRLAAVLAAGALLLVLAGQSGSARWVGWGGIALLVVLVGVTVRSVGRVPPGGLRPLVRLFRRLPALALAAVLLGVGLVVLVGSTVAAVAGVAGVQPLVPVCLCAVLALAVSVPGRVLLRHRRRSTRRARRAAG
jgi:Flp pilus assembly protein TadD